MANKKTKKDTSLHEMKEEVIEDLATAVENDEIKNPDPLEELEEANGKVEETEPQEETEASEKPDLGDLEYTDGKVRDDLDLIEEEERIYGINKVSPFKTADKRLFQKRLEVMTRGEKRELCVRVGCRVFSDPSSLDKELTTAFLEWTRDNGTFQTKASLKKEKKEKSEVFAGMSGVKDLEDKLKSQTLSDLQATAARLGFNPSFDRERLIKAIKQEYYKA